MRYQQGAMADSLRLSGETLRQIPGQRSRLVAEPQRVQEWLKQAEMRRPHAVLAADSSDYDPLRLQEKSHKAGEPARISAQSASAV